MKPLIVGYYTKNTPYEKEAFQLIASCKRGNFDYKLVETNDEGSWEENCAQKPTIMKWFMDHYPKTPMLMLDVDCKLRQSFEMDLSCDLAVDIQSINTIVPLREAVKYRKFAARYNGMWLSGIIYFKVSEELYRLVERWERLCQQDPHEWDQVQMQRAYNEMGLKVNFQPLPKDYIANGKLIKHHSAFHKYSSHKQQWLLLCSAPDIIDWWMKHKSRYIRNRWFIAALNNAWKVPGIFLHVWYRPNDFAGPRPEGDWFYENPDGWLMEPCWEMTGRLSFIDTCYHLLNLSIKSSRKLILHIAGCDMIYPENGPSHFYGNGPPDPLKYGEEWLDAALLRLKEAWENNDCEIINVSDQQETRLPFRRIEK